MVQSSRVRSRTQEASTDCRAYKQHVGHMTAEMQRSTAAGHKEAMSLKTEWSRATASVSCSQPPWINCCCCWKMGPGTVRCRKDCVTGRLRPTRPPLEHMYTAARLLVSAVSAVCSVPCRHLSTWSLYTLTSAREAAQMRQKDAACLARAAADSSRAITVTEAASEHDPAFL